MSRNDALAILDQHENALIKFSDEKVDLIRRTLAEGASNEQLALFLYQAQRMGLDPLSGQIHCVLRWNNRKGRHDMSIQTAIDGYRLIADRTGRYAGSDDYAFDDGKTQYEHIESGRGWPKTATVTVYKVVSGIRVPFTATAEWGAYYPGDSQGFMWRKMPYLMLGKCAEALALRKAFPAELSGVYVREEMEQSRFAMEADFEDDGVVERSAQPPEHDDEDVDDEVIEGGGVEDEHNEEDDEFLGWWRTLLSDEKEAYKANNKLAFLYLVMDNTNRYKQNRFGAAGATEKFADPLPVSEDRESGIDRVVAYKRVKVYAAMRDLDKESEEAIDEALERVPYPFDDGDTVEEDE